MLMFKQLKIFFWKNAFFVIKLRREQICKHLVKQYKYI